MCTGVYSWTESNATSCKLDAGKKLLSAEGRLIGCHSTLSFQHKRDTKYCKEFVEN